MNGSTLTVGFVPNKDRNVKFSAMFGGCITYFGVGTLIPFDGNINSVSRHFANNPWTLQEDNAPCYVSPQTTVWKTENGISTLPWPSHSPDLHIIENVCKSKPNKI